MIEEIKKLAEKLNALSIQAYSKYEPIVNQLISENCQDSNKIGLTLDFMLEFCSNDKVLQLYRKLCRHLYSFDQESAIFYVDAYRERWDEEGTQFGKGNSL
jgi:hypothetical protein